MTGACWQAFGQGKGPLWFLGIAPVSHKNSTWGAPLCCMAKGWDLGLSLRFKKVLQNKFQL